MDATRRLDPTDPEYLPESTPIPVSRLRNFAPAHYQRVIVNPFLGVVGLALLAWLGWIVGGRHDFVWIGTFWIAMPLLLPRLIQFHCLDCGRTESYAARDRHACPAVVARWNEDRFSGFPSARGQLIVWGWILGSVAILGLVLTLE